MKNLSSFQLFNLAKYWLSKYLSSIYNYLQQVWNKFYVKSYLTLNRLNITSFLIVGYGRGVAIMMSHKILSQEPTKIQPRNCQSITFGVCSKKFLAPRRLITETKIKQTRHLVTIYEKNCVRLTKYRSSKYLRSFYNFLVSVILK